MPARPRRRRKSAAPPSPPPAAALVSVAISCLATRTVPPAAFINVVSTFTVVVLPAPFGPSRGKPCPREHQDRCHRARPCPHTPSAAPRLQSLNSNLTSLVDSSSSREKAMLATHTEGMHRQASLFLILKSRPGPLAGHSERITDTTPDSSQLPDPPDPTGQARLDLHARLDLALAARQPGPLDETSRGPGALLPTNGGGAEADVHPAPSGGPVSSLSAGHAEQP